jgi:hypothetical protein
VTAGATTEISALLSSASARTLTLGIDKTGRVLQHDRNSADMLAYPGDALLGTELSSLLAGPSSHTIALEGLLSAALSGREGTAVLTFRTRDGDPLDSVVTIQPMSSRTRTIGLVLIRIPPPSEGRFGPGGDGTRCRTARSSGSAARWTSTSWRASSSTSRCRTSATRPGC